MSCDIQRIAVVRIGLLLLSLLFFSFTNAEPLRVGSLAYDPPFAVEADKQGHFFGFEIDIMLEVCRRIQANCSFLPLTFPEIFTSLMANQIDLGLASISITEDRQQTFLFSTPYLTSSVRFIALAKSAINNESNLIGKKVGAVRGSIFKSVVLAKLGNDVRIIEYPTLLEELQALSNKEVDGIIADTGTAKYWVATNSAMLKLVGQPINVGIGYGIMTTKTKAALIARINNALFAMEKDGTYLKIYNRYFLNLTQ